MRPLDYLESVGWLSDDVWLAHGIHFNDGEIQRLGVAGVGISHCPSSNMLLGSGMCRTLELEQAQCPIGLVVDGSASNDGSNMMLELRQALLIQRLRYGADRVSHLDVLRWATRGSADCLGRKDIGSIRPGMQADLTLFGLDELRFSGSGDPLAALLLCGAHRAEHVMVGGRWRVWQGEITDLDLTELADRHRTLAHRLQGA
jgi:8-oxoguanine deaminase